VQAIVKLVVQSCFQGTSKDCFFVTPALAGIYANQWLIDSGLRRNDIIRDALQRVLCAGADNAQCFSKFVLV